MPAGVRFPQASAATGLRSDVASINVKAYEAC